MGKSRQELIELDLKRNGITDPKVIDAMYEVDRSIFVPKESQEEAFENVPLPIGKGQTISQPYVVAYMAQKLKLEPDDTLLEVGTGCGYNAAVLSRLVNHVYSVEIIEWLANLAKENLKKTDYQNISTRYGDGYQGWPEKAPFDAIILTAAPSKIPEPLKQQLRVGGKLLAPVGTNNQKLMLLEKTAEDRFKKYSLLPVSFVPMTGEVQR